MLLSGSLFGRVVCSCDNPAEKLCKKAENFSLNVRKRLEKNVFNFFRPEKVSNGHGDCSVDNPPETSRQKVEIFRSMYEFVKKIQFFEKTKTSFPQYLPMDS